MKKYVCNLLLLSGVVFLMAGCRRELPERVGFDALSWRELPAEGGTFLINTSKVSAEKVYRYYKAPRPWKFHYVSGNTPGRWKVAKDSLSVKGGWFRLWWQDEQLYLRLKKNAGGQRQVFVVFQIDGYGSYGKRLVQSSTAGAQDSAAIQQGFLPPQ